jgi:hypothetical protein
MDQLNVVKNQMKNKKKQSLTNEVLVSGQTSVRYFAVIIESGMNPLLEFTVRNIYRYFISK